MASTDDVEAAAEAMSDAYTELTVRAPRRDGRFRMRLHAAQVAGMKLATLDLSSSTVRTAPYPTYTVCLPVAGRARVTAGDGSSVVGGERGIVVGPASGEVQVEYLVDDCQVFTVSFDRGALEAELGAMLGRPVADPVRFDLRLDVAACATFARAVAFTGDEVADEGGMAGHPAISRSVGRLVMSSLLLGQPHTHSEELRRPAGVEGPRAVRLAVAAVEERPMELLTVADMARAANLGVRALEEGFRRHLGTSPMGYLRQVRMARAHDELRDADAGTTTATAVAHRWGFAHYGRFAAQYRLRYGCSPSETLRGAPRQQP